MIVVTKKKGESKDNMFRKFSKLYKEEDIVYEVNRKMFFKKDSLLKKERERERIKKRILMKQYGKSPFRHKTQDR